MRLTNDNSINTNNYSNLQFTIIILYKMHLKYKLYILKIICVPKNTYFQNIYLMERLFN